MEIKHAKYLISLKYNWVFMYFYVHISGVYFGVKITTAKQFAKLVAILEQKPYLAKGFHKSLNKIYIKEELNIMGPPSRSGEGWMKVWANFKFKFKLTHNKTERCATGGGPLNINTFSAVEEAAINLLDMCANIEIHLELREHEMFHQTPSQI